MKAARFLIVLLMLAWRAVLAGAGENVDHAGLISAWDDKSIARGQKLFQLACAPCHGNDGSRAINPESRRFGVDKFKSGADPYSLFQTITHGFKNMPSQSWMTPEQRYDVIHYIREAFIKKSNPSQYTAIDAAYLRSLPKFDPTKPAAVDALHEKRDFGPVLESQLARNLSDVLTFKLDEHVSLSYDVHRLRLAAAWQGGFLDLSQTGHYLQRGEGWPKPKGTLLAGLQHWSWAFGGRFDYPTNDLPPRGPLPEAWMHYYGHYVNGNQAVLSYRIEGRDVLELPSVEQADHGLVLLHNLRVGPGTAALRLCAGQPDEPAGESEGVVPLGQDRPDGLNGPAAKNFVLTTLNGLPRHSNGFIAAGAAGQTSGLQWEIDSSRRLVLNIPPSRKARVLQVACFAGQGQAQVQWFGQYLNQARQKPVVDPETLTHGAPRLWPAAIEVAGKLGPATNAYALDTIPVPFNNIYHTWPRTSALAFFPDGRAVVTTYGGDVWIVSGLDAALHHVTWSRFASGLFEPFGAQVIDGLVCVTCRNGIVRLHDLNGDGEADFYETFCADQDVSAFFHSFNFDLQVDSRGNLYYVKCGEYTDYRLPGAVIKVSPDGKKSEVVCTGFRTPNGMGMLPDDRVVVSDNQGNWMPASKINIVRPQGYYGYVQTLNSGNEWAPDGGRIDAAKVKIPAAFDQPIIWMPQEFDNSSGGQLWVDDKRFGPLSGRLLHTSFGKGWMYYLMLQNVAGADQAAIVALPFQFDAGIMRARVNPADGQVYATGMSGWQGPDGGKDGCLQRLRYTGKETKMLDDVKVRAGGIDLKFNFSLDAAGAANADCYHLEQWNYKWAAAYGSDQYSAENPARKGHDILRITAVKLAADGHSVFLQIPGLHPVNQIEIRINLTAADGEHFKELSYLTINAIP